MEMVYLAVGLVEGVGIPDRAGHDCLHQWSGTVPGEARNSCRVP